MAGTKGDRYDLCIGDTEINIVTLTFIEMVIEFVTVVAIQADSGQPSRAGSIQPSGPGSTQPSGPGSTQPSRAGSAQPSGPGSTQPSGPGSAQPSGRGSTQPSGSGSTGATPGTVDVESYFSKKSNANKKKMRVSTTLTFII